MDEKFYDYSVGLNTPYWIQEIRDGKGRLLWWFSTPMELSFFVTFFLVFLVCLFLSPVIQVINNYSFGLGYLIYIYAPYRLARLYCEFEPDGKKMHAYLSDVVQYGIDFLLNEKIIYQGERVELVEEEIVFEKIKL